MSIYIYNTQKTTYTSYAEIQPLAEIQNSLTNVGYDGDELLKLFNFSFYNKEVIQNTLDEVLKSQNIVISSNDMLGKIVIKSSGAKGADLIIAIDSDSKVFNSNFIYSHITNVKKDMMEYLNDKITETLNIDELLFKSNIEQFKVKRLNTIKKLKSALELQESFYILERDNILNYLRQNRELANSMELKLPIPGITSEHSKLTEKDVKSFSNFVPGFIDEYQSDTNSFISVNEIVRMNILLGLPGYLYGTQMLDQLIELIENDNLPGVNEIKIKIKKQILTLESADDIEQKKLSLEFNLQNTKGRNVSLNYLVKNSDIKLFNFNNYLEHIDNKKSLPILLIFGFIIGLIIFILFIMPYRKLINENK